MRIEPNIHAHIDEIQKVWGMITTDPTVTVKQIEEATGMTHRKTYAIVRFLENSGHIQHERGRHCRTVNIPLVEIGS